MPAPRLPIRLITDFSDPTFELDIRLYSTSNPDIREAIDLYLEASPSESNNTKDQEIVELTV